MALHPPYPVLVIAFLIAGLGNGLAEGGWNAYIGRLERANELLGLLHGAYAFGAVISPLVATAIITETGAGWYVFYYIMVCILSRWCSMQSWGKVKGS
jgi:fucose permease